MPADPTVAPTALPGVLRIEPRVFTDARGAFLEVYRADRYARAGIPGPFVQDNHSRSVRGTLRGLHAQVRHAQGKLVYVVRGEIFDVAVDIRRGSPTFGRWIGAALSAENGHQLYIPPGFAHGFCVRSEQADVLYKCTAGYDPQDEITIRWNDPDLAIAWGTEAPVLSTKDRDALPLQALTARLPRYEAAGGAS